MNKYEFCHDLMSRVEALSFKSANTSKQHLAINGEQVKTNNAAASFAQEACLADW